MRTIKHVGKLPVDAGIMMLGDPCYTLPDDGSDRDETMQDWGKFCEMLDAEGIDSKGAIMLPNGAAAVFRTGYGDGRYSVEAEINDGRVMSVTVRFE